MRVAMMVASQFSYPLSEDIIYAPMELAGQIADGLVERGHEVTFYAPPSKGFHHKVVSGKMVEQLQDSELLKQGGREREKIFNLSDQYLLMQLYKDAQAGKFDIAHVHPIDRALPLAELAPIPTVYTLHDPIYPWRETIFELYQSEKQHLVSISEAQRKGGPRLHFTETIYNGIDTARYAFNAEGGDRYCFVGRLIPQKGVKEAIMAAKKVGAELSIVGKTYPENVYLEMEVMPLLDDKIKMVDMTRSELPHLYGRSKALLFPINWEEPFGLVMVEAMACGTPVIAFDRGSVREVIEDGVTGYIVKTVDEMVEAMKNVDKLDRKKCRQWAEERFGLKRMVEGYEGLFQRLLKNPKG